MQNMQNSVSKMGAKFDARARIALLFLGRNFARESRFQAIRAASAYNVAYLASPQNIGAETICPVRRSGATSLNGVHGRKSSV
jgi:hypothetical protein